MPYVSKKPVRKLRKKTGEPVAWRYRKSKSLAEKVTAKVKRTLGLGNETKYIATTLWDKATLDGAIHSIGLPATNSDTMPLVPIIAKGIEENQREGRMVKPVKACVDLNLSFTMNGDPPFAQATQHLYVYIYLLLVS